MLTFKAIHCTYIVCRSINAMVFNTMVRLAIRVNEEVASLKLKEYVDLDNAEDRTHKE